MDSSRAHQKSAQSSTLDEKIIRHFHAILPDQVRAGRHDRMLYATDASIYQVEPLCVVIPNTVEDAHRALKLCAEHGLAVLPRGGGTSLAGQCTNQAVVIDTSAHCCSLLHVDAQNKRCSVEPGITIDALNAALCKHDLYFAPDPATSAQATIGGCIGNNAAGARSIRYGRTSENVHSLDVCLANGHRVGLDSVLSDDAQLTALRKGVCQIVLHHAVQIREKYPQTVRRNAGYNLDLMLDQIESLGAEAQHRLNLTPLMCGSEGTLAMILGANLHLHPVPQHKSLTLISYHSLEAAIEAVEPILETKPSAVELLDDRVLSLARANRACAAFVDAMPKVNGCDAPAVLFVEHQADDSQNQLDHAIESLQKLARGSSMVVLTNATEMAQAWSLRKAAEPLLHGTPGRRKPTTFVEDNAVPVHRLSEFVQRFKVILHNEDTNAAFFAHASVGVLHVRPLIDLEDAQDRKKMLRIAQQTADLASELGGVMSGEHGDGKARGPLLNRFYGSELMAAFTKIKTFFDPKNLLNLGNIIQPGPVASITQQLRVFPVEHQVSTPNVRTYFEYEDQGSFASAVQMCNGAGVCRKTAGGTMCPSYRATLDERHSTRGRGNALRLAISGQLDEPRFDDPQTMQTLDLCLSCKACKSECPSNVDVARLKAEYQAQRFAHIGSPDMRSQIMAQVRLINRVGSMMPGLANSVGSSKLTRVVINRVLGIAPERSLPKYSKERVSVRAHDKPPSCSRPIVGIFRDCFTGLQETSIVNAARDVLSSLGYEAVLIRSGCCGRPAISMGMLEQAIAQGERLIETLMPWVRSDRVAGIVVLEPSCLSVMVDDLQQLRLTQGRQERAQLAASVSSIEDFIENRWDSHPCKPSMSAPQTQSILVHTHCHERALWGSDSALKLLDRFFPGKVQCPDLGCCGMAGAFGMARHRYELSMRIAQDRLVPAIKASDGAIVVAGGTSCRHQITDATGVKALHPIELIASCSPQHD